MVIKARIDVQYLEPVEVLPLWAVLRGAPAAVVFAPRCSSARQTPRSPRRSGAQHTHSLHKADLSQRPAAAYCPALTPLASKAGATGTSC